MPCDADVRIPPAVVDELLLACLSLSCSRTNIRQPVDTVISATDATVKRAGRCRALVPPKIARALYRRCEQRGEDGKLRWSDLEI